MLEKTKREPTDRVVGVLRVLLILIGIAAMGTVMWMTGRFGYGLQDADADRWASAVLHVLGDAAGAGLVAIAGIMLGWSGWRWKAMGSIAMVCALILVTYSIVSVYGFMSTRIAHLQSHKAIISVDQGALDWSRKTSISKDVPKGERMMLRKDAKEAAEKLKKSLSFIPDAQAAGIAAWFGTTTEVVQRGLVVITSCVGQLIKVSCLFFGFSLWAHRSVDAASIRASDEDDAASGGSGGGKKRIKLAFDADDAARKPAAKSAMQAASLEATTQRSAPDASVPAVPVKMPEPELQAYLRNHASGMSQRQIAQATGWSQPSVCRKSRQVRRQEERVARKAARASNEAATMSGYPGFGGRVHSPASI
jgi:hypothetical protein